MKKSLILAAGCIILASCNTQPSFEAIPVTGAFYQMSHDDERYNNMTFEDELLNTDPDMHVQSVCGMHELGIDYLIFPQVGTFESEYYPSKKFAHRYPEGRKSPIDAIMDTCDSLGMHVFLSCGWCFSQYDDIRDSAVIQRSHEIMEELAELYGNRPSFYGWYLPVEDCVSPYFRAESVPGINRLVAYAKKVTPNAKTLISPWGLYLGDLDNPLFFENLSKVNADILAIQDEVGCVRDVFPLPHQKMRLRKLGEMLSKLDMEYWVNVESFTWDRGLNNHFSTLIPAHFGRFLSQIVEATESGPTRIISFAFNGILQKPGSTYGLGQGEESDYAYAVYKEWLEGSPRLKLLERSFAGTQKNMAKGCRICYTENGLPSRELSKGQEYLNRLVDGKVGYEDPACEDFVCFTTKFDVTIDLKKVRDVKAVSPRFLNYSPKWVRMPAWVALYTSTNGTDWTEVATVPGPHVNSANDHHDCWIDNTYFANVGPARYIRLVAPGSMFSITYCDEIFVEW